MFLTFFSILIKKINNYFTYRQTVYELNQLSNRDLADLGIQRGDIEFIARKHSMSRI